MTEHIIEVVERLQHRWDKLSEKYAHLNTALGGGHKKKQSALSQLAKDLGRLEQALLMIDEAAIAAEASLKQRGVMP